MLFNTRPKEDRKDLYDREKEIEMIKESIARGEWIAVLGMRRIGKTSVVNVAVKESGLIRVSINLMRIHDSRKKQYPKDVLISLLIEEINEAIKNYTILGKVAKLLSNVLGVEEIQTNKVRAKLKKIRGTDVTYVIREMDSIARNNKKQLVIILDEAQELAKVNGLDFPSIFHDVYDNCKNTVIIFTGSMVKLIEKTLKNIEYTEPFFGRYIRKITLERFLPEQIREFLEKGFEEEGIKVDEGVIDEAVKRLDGIPGWLTLFGSEYTFSVKMGTKPRIDEIVEKAINEVRNEARNFILSTQSPLRYSAVILALDRLGGKGELNEIVKVSSAILNENIPEPRVYEILNRLVEFDFIERREDDGYYLHQDEPNRKGLILAAKDSLASYSI
ncbi:MAG: ATP-binding protein [Saccharolobus sp.]|uniref:AAA family ATPase n=2 Tax=Sulfolobaceae TaxID=118883 RepID=UPI001F0D7AE1|nr:ATP-binding protein [Saccharolobus shibatae]MCH4816309.1 ATP-binding protein [Saccharolobus shibatae]